MFNSTSLQEVKQELKQPLFFSLSIYPFPCSSFISSSFKVAATRGRRGLDCLHIQSWSQLPAGDKMFVLALLVISDARTHKMTGKPDAIHDSDLCKKCSPINIRSSVLNVLWRYEIWGQGEVWSLRRRERGGEIDFRSKRLVSKRQDRDLWKQEAKAADTMLRKLFSGSIERKRVE